MVAFPYVWGMSAATALRQSVQPILCTKCTKFKLKPVGNACARHGHVYVRTRTDGQRENIMPPVPSIGLAEAKYIKYMHGGDQLSKNV